MEKYLPFYMVYGMEDYIKNVVRWDEDVQLQRDYDYMKSTYPNMTKRIMPYIEKECDRMEYTGSVMYDEYPDQLQIRLMCRRIMDKIINEDTIIKHEGKYSMKRIPGESRDNWLQELIWVLTWQEILKRRSDYRKYR